MKIFEDVFEELETDKKYIPIVMIIVIGFSVAFYLKEKFSSK
jgi:hypothetical protein